MSYYIYYNTNGNIIAVANDKDDSFGEHCIEVDFEVYENFGNDTYKMHEWAVLASPKNSKVVELIKRQQETQEFDPDKSIKQIPKVSKQSKNAFIIVQDTKKGTWTLKTTLDDIHLIYYSQTDGYVDQTKNLYVIEEDNPNVLLDTLTIKFKDLLTKNKYDVKMYNNNVARRKDVSLICSRLDEEFIHIVR